MPRINAALIALLGMNMLSATQASVIFDVNSPPVGTNGGSFFAFDSNTNTAVQATIADDFEVAERVSLTGLTWWTRDFFPTRTDLDFQFTLWEESGANQPGVEMYTEIFADVIGTPDATGEYVEWMTDLKEPRLLEPNTYWLSLAIESDAVGTFWRYTADGFGELPLLGLQSSFGLPGGINLPAGQWTSGEYGDNHMAFELRGEEVPIAAPALLMLLGIPGLILSRARLKN